MREKGHQQARDRQLVGTLLLWLWRWVQRQRGRETPQPQSSESGTLHYLQHQRHLVKPPGCHGKSACLYPCMSAPQATRGFPTSARLVANVRNHRRGTLNPLVATGAASHCRRSEPLSRQSTHGSHTCSVVSTPVPACSRACMRHARRRSFRAARASCGLCARCLRCRRRLHARPRATATPTEPSHRGCGDAAAHGMHAWGIGGGASIRKHASKSAPGRMECAVSVLGVAWGGCTGDCTVARTVACTGACTDEHTEECREECTVECFGVHRGESCGRCGECSRSAHSISAAGGKAQKCAFTASSTPARRYGR
jgi:hypothetical protein